MKVKESLELLIPFARFLYWFSRNKCWTSTTTAMPHCRARKRPISPLRQLFCRHCRNSVRSPFHWHRRYSVHPWSKRDTSSTPYWLVLYWRCNFFLDFCEEQCGIISLAVWLSIFIFEHGVEGAESEVKFLPFLMSSHLIKHVQIDIV